MSLDTLTSEQESPAKPDTSKRSDNFVFGIPQNGLEHKQREVLLDEPPPLGPNSELMYIGKPTVRYDGPAKAMGSLWSGGRRRARSTSPPSKRRPTYPFTRPTNPPT